ADIALRPTCHPPEHWIGRKLSPILCATYAHERYWRTTESRPAEDQRWVTLDDDLDQSPMSQITTRKKPKGAKVTVVNTMMGVFDMVRSGLGIAAMPCYLGEACPGLVRVHEPDDSTPWDLWLLAHPDVRRSARVHAFFEFAGSSIKEDILGIPYRNTLG
ncbi:MAG: LysR family transcriptional regulator, partial [Pseudomonadota bacterium]